MTPNCGDERNTRAINKGKANATDKNETNSGVERARESEESPTKSGKDETTNRRDSRKTKMVSSKLKLSQFFLRSFGGLTQRYRNSFFLSLSHTNVNWQFSELTDCSLPESFRSLLTHNLLCCVDDARVGGLT